MSGFKGGAIDPLSCPVAKALAAFNRRTVGFNSIVALKASP